MSASNFDTFRDELEKQYTALFESDPDYAYSKSHMTAQALAQKMTEGLQRGGANKDGKGIKNTCKKLGIPYTYAGIKDYLSQKTAGKIDVVGELNKVATFLKEAGGDYEIQKNIHFNGNRKYLVLEMIGYASLYHTGLYMRDFEKRIGEAGEYVEKALKASGVTAGAYYNSSTGCYVVSFKDQVCIVGEIFVAGDFDGNPELDDKADEWVKRFYGVHELKDRTFKNQWFV